MATQTKKTMTMEDELASCLRILARSEPVRRHLSDEVQGLETQVEEFRLNRIDPLLRQISGLNNFQERGAREKLRAMLAARQRELDDLQRQLSAKREELSKIEAELHPAARRAQELQDEVKASRSKRISGMVAAAVAAAPSREKFEAEEKKLCDLRALHLSTKAEVERIQATPQVARDYSIEAKAAILLDVGAFPSESQQPALSVRVKELSSRAELLFEATRLQQNRRDAVREAFSAEVAASLLGARQDIICRIAEGFGVARSAGLDERLLRAEFASAVGGIGILPDCTYNGLPMPSDDDGFTNWVRHRRAEGFEV